MFFQNGKEIGEAKLPTTNYNFMDMYMDWIKADYEWFSSIKSGEDYCHGYFAEKVAHSNSFIRDTPQSIEPFIQNGLRG